MMLFTASQTSSLDEQVDAFLSDFNRMNLDAVMQYFAPDAIYEPGDGCRYEGTAAIRRAFEPQFAGAFGTMFFEGIDRIVDPDQRKVALSWVCRIDLRRSRFFSWRNWFRVTLGRLAFGTRAAWRGLDLLYFDSEGLIVKKLTYAHCSKLKIVKE
jgi:ketosteroid isomerase-like protein